MENELSMKEFPIVKFESLFKSLMHLFYRGNRELSDYALTLGFDGTGEVFVFLLKIGEKWEVILTAQRHHMESINRNYGLACDRVIAILRSNHHGPIYFRNKLLTP